MGYACKILADSMSPAGVRLTTFEVTFPRIVLAEFNTHRMLSRNSASSRAIPVEKQIERVLMDPFIPVHFGKNQKGMKAEQELQGFHRDAAIRDWLLARDEAVGHATLLHHRGVHKQITNRLLEPFMWHTVIVSATEWENFFNLRCHPDAQPEIQRIAVMMRDALEAGHPMANTSWHLPLVDFDDHAMGDIAEADLPWVSAGRCARVSYLTHDGRRDPAEDVALAKRLQASGHMSPFEHVAQANVGTGSIGSYFIGNFRGWIQLRKLLPNEDVFRP